MQAALDTNLLVYAEGVAFAPEDAVKSERIRGLLVSLPADEAALPLAGDQRLSIWDAVVLAAAAEAGCRMLLSEDFEPGFAWRGVTVVNPVAAVHHPLLEMLLANGRRG
ncbi:MAG TPA: VapC toxin family PIN domain ribonuclease [Stellaceae bacterium]|nr:VapC toxin family PIN domain ribonuclease [Stellaceae bacterium]